MHVLIADWRDGWPHSQEIIQVMYGKGDLQSVAIMGMSRAEGISNLVQQHRICNITISVVAAPGIASITALTITRMSFVVRGASTEALILPSEQPLTLRLLELEAQMELTLRVIFAEELGVDFPLPRLLLNWLLDLDFLL